MRTRFRRAAVLLGSVPLLTLAVTSPARAGAYEDEVFACLTERRQPCVQAYLALATAIVTLRALLRAAWYRYRWDTRPRSPRIR